MQFLLVYSDRFNAQRTKLPLSGTAVEIDSMDELLALQTSMGSDLIIHEPGYVPFNWEFAHLGDAEEALEEHRLHPLPDGWETARYIEVYNGYRE